jgi:uncharacterized protein (TIGR03382 family)
MWAAHRVERLMAADRETGSSGSSKDEIVRLCEGYSITSEFASFIVLENDAEFQRWSIQRRNATRVTRDRNAQLALRKELEQLRDATVAKLGPDQPVSEQRANTAKIDPTRFSTSAPIQPAATPAPIPAPVPTIDSPRSRDIAVPSFTSGGGSGGGGGGCSAGAIDPLMVLGLIGLPFAALRSRRRKP